MLTPPDSSEIAHDMHPEEWYNSNYRTLTLWIHECSGSSRHIGGKSAFATPSKSYLYQLDEDRAKDLFQSLPKRSRVKAFFKLICLVVSTHSKNISQIGSFPHIGMKIRNIFKPPPPPSYVVYFLDAVHFVYGIMHNPSSHLRDLWFQYVSNLFKNDLTPETHQNHFRTTRSQWPESFGSNQPKTPKGHCMFRNQEVS